LNIYNLEQYILFLLIKYNELDLRDLKLLKEEGYVEFIEEHSEEYKKCLEKQSDKRIKNIAKYCRERYPSKILVRITENGKIKYIHNCYCLSYCNTKNEETALLNMALCEELADMKTMPPEECLC
jgi:hypothetical protein